MNIGSALEKLINCDQSHSYLIAYSGGVDSQVLLHALATLRQQDSRIQLRAMHIHHGLSEFADQWVEHCRQVCNTLAVPFLTEKIELIKNSDSLEAQARSQRYQQLALHLQEQESLLTAHHQDDQAETLLLQLLRGAGPKGLAAMPNVRPFAHSRHWRPLLDVSRKTILQYAQQHCLQWVDDHSNFDQQFDRNYLRYSVMPLLKRRWPAAVATLSRSAAHCGDAMRLIDDMASDDIMDCRGLGENTLSISALLALSTPRRNNALRYWLHLHGALPPSTQQLRQIDHDVLGCDRDANPIFILGDCQLRRYRDDLYLIARRDLLADDIELQWDASSPLTLPAELGVLQPSSFTQFKKPLSIRFRRGGEMMKPAGSAHSVSLKKLLQQWGVPPWRRDQIPLVFEGERLVAVVVDEENVIGG